MFKKRHLLKTLIDFSQNDIITIEGMQMSSFFINHKNCPECGARIKGYYYYCGKCGNDDVTDWKLSGLTFLIVGVIFFLIIYFVMQNFCENSFFLQAPFCKY